MQTTTRTYKCARCGNELRAEHWIYSNQTGSRYCWPGEGCNRSAWTAEHSSSPRSLASFDLADDLEEEPTGQTSIGVAGEQRAMPGLATEGKPAPVIGGYCAVHSDACGCRTCRHEELATITGQLEGDWLNDEEV